VPTRQGTHLPHDSFLKKRWAFSAMSSMHVPSAQTTIAPEPSIEPAWSSALKSSATSTAARVLHMETQIGLVKPGLFADLVGFDGVAISNAGGFPACPPFCAFFGTSAAAPHSAGIAALLLDQDPTLTPAEVQAALTRGAVDIGPQGFDDASGFGRLCQSIPTS